MSKSHQHEAQNVHSASVCSKVKIAISFSLSQACQPESTSKEQSRPDQEGRKGSEEGVPENLRVPLEGDRDFGELCGSHQ